MAKNILSFDFTTHPEEALLIQKRIFTDPQLQDIFRVFQSVGQNGMRIPLANRLKKIIKKLNGNSRTASGKMIDITNRILTVQDAGISLEQDSTELYNTIMEQLLNSGLESEDITGTQIQTLIEGWAETGLKEDLPRVIYFSKLSDPSSDYDQCDGLWHRIFQLAAVNPTMKVATAIPDTLPTAADDVLDLFYSLYSAQSIDMRAIPAGEKRFFVNGEIYEALYQAYTKKASVDGALVLSMIRDGEGRENLAYNNIAVIPMWNWTDIITNDLGGQHKWRMLLVDKENLCIGTDRVSDLMTMEFAYHKYQSTNTLRSRFKLGTQVLYPDGVVYRTSAQVAATIFPAVVANSDIQFPGVTPLVGVQAGGTSHTVRGRGFIGTTGAAGVKLGGTNVTSYVVVDDTTITFVAPARAAGSHAVIVTNAAGASAASTQLVVIP